MDWIAKRVREALAAKPIGEAIAARLEEELAGTMCERTLRNTELAELARELIAATNPTTEEAP